MTKLAPPTADVAPPAPREPSAVASGAAQNNGPPAIAARPPTFRELYDRHARAVLNGIVGFGVKSDERFDIAQNAWMRILRQLGSFRGENERAWVGSAARAAWLDWCRTLARHPDYRKTAEDETEVEPAPDTRTPETLVIARERRELLGTLLMRLVPNEDQRHALVLFEVFEWDLAQIAAETGVSVTTVQGRLRMARSKLEKGLTDEERDQLRGFLPVLGVDAFLDALRSSATDEDVAELERRLADVLPPAPAASPPPEATSTPPPSSPSTLDPSIGYLLTGKQIGVGAIGIFALGAVVANFLSPPSAQAHSAAPISVEPLHSAVGVVVPTASAPPAPLAPKPAPTPSPTAARPAPEALPARRPVTDPVWESETLLARARSQVGRAPAQAIALTAEHARRFPRLDANEREMIAIRALAKLGRRTEAEERGRALLARAAWTRLELQSVLGSTFL